MKTKEQAHRDTVRSHIETISDDETRRDITDLTSRYEKVRMHLLAAATSLRELDALNFDDYSNYEELRHDLGMMLRGLRSDEIALLELVSEVKSDADQSPTVQRGSSEFAAKNDVTVSGMSDTALLSALDGKAY
jgi:hypothetical protein